MELRLNPEWLRNQDTTLSSILYLGHPLHSEQCNSAFAHGKSMIPSSGNLVACRHSHTVHQAQPREEQRIGTLLACSRTCRINMEKSPIPDKKVVFKCLNLIQLVSEVPCSQLFLHSQTWETSAACCIFMAHCSHIIETYESCTRNS